MLQEIKNRKVFVAMSGGVDSSVAALLLKQAGCQVTGVTMNLWPRPQCGRSCCGLEAAEDARRVCWHLDIPHYVLNYRDAFKQLVIGPFCDEYLLGRTPNPCMRCNELIKFNLLLKQCLAMGADYLATGHYARITALPSGERGLFKAVDTVKDQSYFLCGLTQQELPRLVFPLGSFRKPEIRRMAVEAGLPVAAKADSQEICFIGSEGYASFVSRERPEGIQPGTIRHRDGCILGWHGGVHRFTVGQRRGLGIASGRPLYVLAIDAVSTTVWVGDEDDLWMDALQADHMTLVRPLAILPDQKVEARIRYGARPARGRIIGVRGNSFELRLAEPQRAITPGQTVALYINDEVIGGGIIQAANQNRP